MDQHDYRTVHGDPDESEETTEAQVLGTTVTVPKRVTQAEEAAPETGTRRDEEGRPVA